MHRKIFDRRALVAWISEQRAAGFSIGLTCGAFDILHAGHVEYLAQARRHCDRLIVAVNSDASIQAYKNPLRPVTPEEQRMFVVAGLEAVDAVTLMPETRPTALIELIHPDLYIKGGDYAPEQLESKPLVESYGGRVRCIPVVFESSTTEILKRAADIELHVEPPEIGAPGERRLVFLDRDGTLIRDVPFLHDAARVELMPGVPEGLKRLQDAAFTLVMVTNQQGIGLGYYTEREFIEVNRELFRQLAPAGVRVSRIYYCPHSLADECECRKPGSLLLEQALQYYGALPERCYFLGDSLADCKAAGTVGCRSILIGNQTSDTSCTYRAASFADAVAWILAHRDAVSGS